MSTFLVAEDEKPLAKALEHKLLDRGHRVLLAGTGQELLTLLTKEQPDAILLDLIMPDGDGFSVLQQLHDQASTPPIIVSSNLAQPEDRRKVLSLGASGFISKADSSLEDIIKQLEAVVKTDTTLSSTHNQGSDSPSDQPTNRLIEQPTSLSANRLTDQPTVISADQPQISHANS